MIPPHLSFDLADVGGVDRDVEAFWGQLVPNLAERVHDGVVARQQPVAEVPFARPCCMDRRETRSDPGFACAQVMRMEIGRPRSSMRFWAWTATFTSVARRLFVCGRSLSPITCLNLPMVASTLARML